MEVERRYGARDTETFDSMECAARGGRQNASKKLNTKSRRLYGLFTIECVNAHEYEYLKTYNMQSFYLRSRFAF